MGEKGRVAERQGVWERSQPAESKREGGPLRYRGSGDQHEPVAFWWGELVFRGGGERASDFLIPSGGDINRTGARRNFRLVQGEEVRAGVWVQEPAKGGGSQETMSTGSGADPSAYQTGKGGTICGICEYGLLPTAKKDEEERPATDFRITMAESVMGLLAKRHWEHKKSLWVRNKMLTRRRESSSEEGGIKKRRRV